jgi:hypothetical protein
VAASGVIEVRLKELNQLFDSLDPSPFAEKDLDPKAERYIVDSYREMPGRLVRDTAPVYADALSVFNAMESYRGQVVEPARQVERALAARRD